MQIFNRRIEGVEVRTSDGALAWSLKTGGGSVILSPGQCTTESWGLLVESLFGLPEAFDEVLSVSTTGTVRVGRLA